MARYNEDSDLDKSPTSSKGPHPDYEYNLNASQIFIKNITPSLLPGMKVYINSSQWLKDSLLMICYIPPKDFPLGNYATSIFLHQSRHEVSKAIESIFNKYMLMARKYEPRGA